MVDAPAMNAPTAHSTFERRASPFDLDDEASYRQWRAWKLAVQPQCSEDLIVDVRDPRCLSEAERAALQDRIVRANLAIYRSAVFDADPSIARELGAQLGMYSLDANWLAGEDGISSITVASAPDRDGFIPYTNRAIGWHTDGYYHPAARRIHGMILHCVRPALSGGLNFLLDHELAYIVLRDTSPDHLRALMQPDAMTIPARHDPRASDASESGAARAAQSGPVISVDADTASVHFRYTARQKSIEWRADTATQAARACLEALLAADNAAIHRFRLQAGMGVVGHNILHGRSAFEDDSASPRLLYRARFLDRITPPRPTPWRIG